MIDTTFIICVQQAFSICKIKDINTFFNILTNLKKKTRDNGGGSVRPSSLRFLHKILLVGVIHLGGPFLQLNYPAYDSVKSYYFKIESNDKLLALEKLFSSMDKFDY